MPQPRKPSRKLILQGEEAFVYELPEMYGKQRPRGRVVRMEHGLIGYRKWPLFLSNYYSLKLASTLFPEHFPQFTGMRMPKKHFNYTEISNNPKHETRVKVTVRGKKTGKIKRQFYRKYARMPSIYSLEPLHENPEDMAKKREVYGKLLERRKLLAKQYGENRFDDRNSPEDLEDVRMRKEEVSGLDKYMREKYGRQLSELEQKLGAADIKITHPEFNIGFTQDGKTIVFEIDKLPQNPAKIFEYIQKLPNAVQRRKAVSYLFRAYMYTRIIDLVQQPALWAAMEALKSGKIISRKSFDRETVRDTITELQTELNYKLPEGEIDRILKRIFGNK